jgi:hypothetical protein
MRTAPEPGVASASPSRRRLLAGGILVIVPLGLAASWTARQWAASREWSPALVARDVLGKPTPVPAPVVWRWVNDRKIELVRYPPRRRETITLTAPPGASDFRPVTTAAPLWVTKPSPVFVADHVWMAWRVSGPTRDQVFVARPDGTSVATFPANGAGHNLIPLADGRLAAAPSAYGSQSQIVVWDVNTPARPPVRLRHPALRGAARGRSLRPWVLGFRPDGSVTAVDLATTRSGRKGHFTLGAGTARLHFTTWGTAQNPVEEPVVTLLILTPTADGKGSETRNREVRFGPGVETVSATLSPDGGHIAWLTYEHRFQNRSETIQRSIHKFAPFVPAPDGRRLRLWVSDSDGENLRELANLGDSFRTELPPPVWLPGGKAFSFLSRGDLYRINVPTSR